MSDNATSPKAKAVPLPERIWAWCYPGTHSWGSGGGWTENTFNSDAEYLRRDAAEAITARAVRLALERAATLAHRKRGDGDTPEAIRAMATDEAVAAIIKEASE